MVSFIFYRRDDLLNAFLGQRVEIASRVLSKVFFLLDQMMEAPILITASILMGSSAMEVCTSCGSPCHAKASSVACVHGNLQEQCQPN